MLDIMTAAPKPIRLGTGDRNRVYMVGPLKLAEFGLLMRWIRDNAPSPLKRLEDDLKNAPEEEHRKLRYEAWAEQRDDWPPAPYSPKGVKILFAELEGIRRFLEVFLGKYNAVTDEEITFLLTTLGMAELDTLVMIAYGADDISPEQAWAVAREMRRPSQGSTASSPPAPGLPEGSPDPGESSSMLVT